MPRSCLSLCFMFILWANTAYSLDTVRPKVACFPLAAKSIDAMAYNEVISSKLVNAIDRPEMVELVERKKIEAIIEQHGLRLDTLDLAGLQDVGARAGLDFILTGSVGRSDGKLSIEVNLIRTRSPKAIHNWTYKINDSEISAKLEELAALVVPKLKEFSDAPAPAAPSAVLSAPSELTSSGSTRSIRLKWNQAAPEKVSGYKISRAGSPDGPFSYLATCSATSYTDDNLQSNASFYYRVKSLGKEGGESDLSPAVQGRTIIAPQAPILIHVQHSPGSAALSWYQRPISGTDANLVAATFRVYRAESGKNDFKQVAQIDGAINAYIDSHLAHDLTYQYYVVAVNAAGEESEPSAKLEATTAGAAAP